MTYYLRKSNRSKGIYLQMYDRYWDSDRKQCRQKHIRSFGYVDDLASDEIPDPVSYFQHYVDEKNAEIAREKDEATRERINCSPRFKYAGHFLLHALIDELGVRETIDLLASQTRFQFSIYDMITQLIYSRVLSPGSKLRDCSVVFPSLYRGNLISDDQVYDGLFFVGSHYKKYIELFNRCYESFFKRNYDHLFFDCTNYYFEIDAACEDKQKGPSKEKRTDPIIGQALLLDSDLVPLAMEMYPGNESEKPYIRKIIEDMKQRHRVSGRTVQVADKGLNCARNIRAAIDGGDGYIFSKGIHGTNLSAQEKQWILLENDANVFTDYTDEKGNIVYRIKSCVDTFDYVIIDEDPETGKKKKHVFKVKEKRVVSYNPSLAKKQRAEIMKQVDKAARYKTHKQMAKDELGDSAKYIKVTSKDKDGKKIKPVIEMNQAKIDEDLKYAGYNLIVTSELDMEPQKIYETYHNLWKIEESFRITKSYLDARPVYLQKRETIYGHFLICYLSLFLLRILEIKVFDHKINTYDLIHFMRDFKIVKQKDGSYINLSTRQLLNEKVKKLTGLTLIDALYLTEKEVDNFFDNCMLPNF